MLKTLLLFTLLGFARHDFHVSVTYMELNEKTQSLQISSKLFTDDLELALEKNFGTRCRIGTAHKNPATDSLIARYFLGRFHLKNNGKPLHLQWVGKEMEQDITFIYLEVPDAGALNELSVSNSLFFDRFEDQSNIVNAKIRGELKSIFLEESTPRKTMLFD